MNAVGIDVSKGKSMVAVLRPLGVVVAKPFEVGHTASELGKLSAFLKSLDGETKVIMEHTGRYYEPVAQAIHDQGLFVSAVNPLLIREYGGNSLRRVKTDKADARKIARYALDNWAELREYTPMDIIRYELKTLNRQFHLTSRNRTACSNNLVSLLDQSFPGANRWFQSPTRKDGSQKWVDFAMAFWHVDCVRGVSRAAFTERYRKWCKRHRYNFSAEKAEQIHREAREMIALVPKSATTKLLIQEAAAQLLSLSCTAEILRAEMNHMAAELPEYPVVMGMCGIGTSLGPQLMAEIGDIRRFAGKQSLVAFAGVDPMPNQSGMKNSRSNRSSKRGSPCLRKTLFNIMTVLLRNAPLDEHLYQFLDRKRAEGKPYYVYMTAGANKFLRIYYGKVRDHLAALVIPLHDTTSADPQ
ncbi:MAG: IS110 family transposase [Rhodopirellula sp.]|nr:IS110 family transposase [Rhodopirellula sp.]